MSILNFFKRGVWIFKSVKNSVHFLKNHWQNNGRSWGGCAVLVMRAGGDQGSGSLCRAQRCHPHTLPMPGKAAQDAPRHSAQAAEGFNSFGIQQAWRSACTYTASFVCCTCWLKERQVISTEKPSVTKGAPEWTGSLLTGGDGVKIEQGRNWVLNSEKIFQASLFMSLTWVK